jgi:uncharacterized protein YkwD
MKLKLMFLLCGLACFTVLVENTARAQGLSCEGARMHWLINEYRRSQPQPLPALKVSIALTRASQWHVQDMADRNYFDHNSPGGAPRTSKIVCDQSESGSPAIEAGQIEALANLQSELKPRTPFERMADFGYDYKTTKAENIAAGNAGAVETFCQWKNSPGHNKNMLHPKVLVIGIGSVIQPRSTFGSYWNTGFGGKIDETFEEPLSDDPGCVLPSVLPRC